ncbi:MAG TPA: ATP-grasp domain-containing protein [candidate division Zixibacteria bacterium]|nr:ATP-grasp domain-containing protein [candidate division Zixibacteria bacterium]
MRILVTDGHYKNALGIVRALGREHEVWVTAPRRLAMAGVSRFAHRLLIGPPPSEAQFVTWLDRVVRRHRFELIIPVGARACEALSRTADRWGPGTAVVIAPPEAMARALDKRQAMQLAAEVGLAVPRTAEPRSIDDAERAAQEVGHPLVVKAPMEGTTGVGYVDHPGQTTAAVRAWQQRHGLGTDVMPILQQRIVGRGYGVFATYQDGRCVRLAAHRRVREFPPEGGESTCCELEHDPDVLAAGRRLLDALGWHGVAMVELKRHDADGRLYLMEVNPKFWGSLDLMLAAGADFPGDLVRIARGERLEPVPPPTGELRFCWPLGNDLRHLLARPGAWRTILGDWFGGARTNLRAGDPLPHLVELAGTLARAALGRRA